MPLVFLHVYLFHGFNQQLEFSLVELKWTRLGFWSGGLRRCGKLEPSESRIQTAEQESCPFQDKG